MVQVNIESSSAEWWIVWLSAVALLISVASFALAFHNHRRDRPHLSLGADLSTFFYPGQGWGPVRMAITVRNDGRYDEVVTGVGLAGSEKKLAFGLWPATPQNPTKPLPWPLSPGNAETGHALLSELKQQVRDELAGRVIHAYADCASGRHYQIKLSRKLRRDLEGRSKES